MSSCYHNGMSDNMGTNMKSSTLRRSTLSRESMEVIETLAKVQENNGSIGEYLRADDFEDKPKEGVNKAQEIDLLWQNFKTTQFGSNSPAAYITLGFFIGVIVTSLVFFGIHTYAKKSGKFGVTAPANTIEEVIEETVTEESQETPAEEKTEQEQVENVSNQQETAAEEKPAPQKQEEVNPVSNTAKMKKYVVKNGDTGESIIKHFYGAYTPERADAIIKANNLKTLDRINIDQELLIPIEQ